MIKMILQHLENFITIIEVSFCNKYLNSQIK